MTPTSQHKKTAGLPPSGGPAFLIVGKLRRPHGVKGEMKMSVLTDFPDLLVKGLEVFVGEDYLALTIRSIRSQGETILISFEEYFDRDKVGVHRNKFVSMRTEDFPSLPEGEYFFHQLLGLKVIDEDAQKLGSVVDIIETGANNIYVVRNVRGDEILLPAIEGVIIAVDLELKEMRVRLLPGLL